MKFHEYRSTYERSRAARIHEADKVSARDWYAGMAWEGEIANVVSATEAAWHRESRPYYSVWPLCAESLTHVRLTGVAVSNLTLPVESLWIRFALGSEPRAEGDSLLGMLIARDAGGLMVAADFGDRTPGPDGKPWPLADFMALRESHAGDIEENLATVDLSTQRHGEAGSRLALRIAVGVCLLGEDSDLIVPDVLADDAGKFAETLDPALVARAVRRGKRGWNVGATMQVAPHMRRAHFALRWTGEGRHVPKIVPVRGAIVRRKKITEVPSGYLDHDEK